MSRFAARLWVIAGGLVWVMGMGTGFGASAQEVDTQRILPDAMGAVQRRHARSKAHFAEGVAATQVGAWARAVEAFTASAELVARPNTLFNIALAQAQLGESAAAYIALQRYLELIQAGENGSALVDSVGSGAEAQTLLEQLRTQVALLHLEVEPGGASVTLDGALVVPSSAGSVPRALMPGSHRLEVRAPGFGVVGRILELSAGDVLELSLSLERLSPTAAESAVVTRPALDTAVRLSPLSGAAAERIEDGPSLWTNPWIWTVGAAVVVLVGTAVVMKLDTQDANPGYGGTIGVSL